MRCFLLVVFFLFIQDLKSLNTQDIDFGTDETLEILTWNIEWFPKAGQTTVSYVEEIVLEMDVDLIAVQEIEDKNAFRQIGEDLEGYESYVPDGDYSSLGYIYKSATLTDVAIYTIYSTSSYWNAFPRAPLVIEFKYRDQQFYVINNHLKCCGNGDLDIGNTSDEEYRRYQAMNLLKDYVDSYLPTEKVVIVGDMNDELTDNLSDNVFKSLINDPNNFLFADMEIAEGNSNYFSYPSWPSHLDHILITNELFDNLSNANSSVATLLVDDYMNSWWSYDNYVSDHRPVGLKLDGYTMNDEIKLQNTRGLSLFPNPVKKQLSIQVRADLVESNFQILSAFGEILYQGTLKSSLKQIHVDLLNLSAGLYFVKIEASGNSIVERFVVE